MNPSLDRVYVNQSAREVLGWKPKVSFLHALQQVESGEPMFRPLTYQVGIKPYAIPDGN